MFRQRGRICISDISKISPAGEELDLHQCNSSIFNCCNLRLKQRQRPVRRLLQLFKKNNNRVFHRPPLSEYSKESRQGRKRPQQFKKYNNRVFHWPPFRRYPFSRPSHLLLINSRKTRGLPSSAMVRSSTWIVFVSE